ncbi:carbohydrate ABC transporter permease [Wenjunlia tyrosinilytica]|uniref:Sugar ABC transporter permease n=1 Tax=Wenjunlia tyrosinilytica TaxID=1544741 RepID=A0A917ZSB2_9ACTN|nr:sugar ABC transporter permease [Wenjunlia tyrosinilytica]GGO92315.1 sugar ABC transporter permease [Wenjunlia tyrosinilytica]
MAVQTAEKAPPAPKRSAGGAPEKRGRKRAFGFDRKVTPYLFVIPFFVVFGVFGLYPILYTFWVSLHDWHLVNGELGFVGLDNFTELFHDPDFYRALRNTLSIFVISTFPQLLFALGIAWMLDTKLRARSFWRSAVLVPNVVSIVAVGVVFSQMFAPSDWSVSNWLLSLVGLGAVDWPANVWSSHLAISVMVIWRWTGYNALIYLAAMQAVPRELYESAELDGASRWTTFWSVTVPSIRPTIVFTVVISTIGGLQLFTEPLLFGGVNGQEGGSDHQFQTLTLLLYKYAFVQQNSGYASAISWVLFLLIALMAVVNLLLVRRISSTR